MTRPAPKGTSPWPRSCDGAALNRQDLGVIHVVRYLGELQNLGLVELPRPIVQSAEALQVLRAAQASGFAPSIGELQAVLHGLMVQGYFRFSAAGARIADVIIGSPA